MKAGLLLKGTFGGIFEPDTITSFPNHDRKETCFGKSDHPTIQRQLGYAFRNQDLTQ